MRYLWRKMHSEKGFTILELLIVFTVIGLITAVILVSIQRARMKSRDARRMRDIEEIHNAIELYINAAGHAPDLGVASCGDPISNDNSCFVNDMNSNYINPSLTWATLQSQLAGHIDSLGHDPCGAGCFANDGSHPYRGYFTYAYQAPAMLNYLNDPYYGGPGTATVTSYRIYAQNLESKVKSFGFGVGSF